MNLRAMGLNLGRLCVGLGLLMGTAQVQAQALPTASGPGAYLAGGIAFSHYQADYGENYIDGWGGYVDANVTWRFGVEAEYRNLDQNTVAETSQKTYLVGPHISFRPKRLRPYVKFLVGRGIFNYPYGYAQGSYFVMAPGGGVDFELGNRINLRLADVEYQRWPNFGGPGTNYKFGTLSPYGISFGVAYKFFNGKSWIW